MAILHPHPPREMVSSERKVYEALENLGDSWYGFYSVIWQSLRNGRQGDGEADFVILHPHHGILVLEVKGGRIEIENGEWYAIDRENVRHRIKNPFEQAKKSKYALLRYLESLGPSDSIPICHGIALTDVVVTQNVGMYGPRPLILDKRDLDAPECRLRGMFEHWEQQASLSFESIEAVVDLLRPTVSLRVPLAAEFDDMRASLEEMTTNQLRAFQQTRRNRRAVVYGGAGTGKTVLAMERARTFMKEGFDTLLTCYNSLLADQLSSLAAEGPHEPSVYSFHGLCLREARRAGVGVPDNPDDRWWTEEAPQLLREAAGEQLSFDAIVVDEGQDFRPEWIRTLNSLLSDAEESPFYVFADSRQRLHEGSDGLPNTWPTFVLDYNCRNTRPIAEAVSALYEEDALVIHDEGREPILQLCEDKDTARILIPRLVRRLLEEEELDPSQLTVLSDSRKFVDALQDGLVGETPFTALGGYGVAVETIQRFKGLENDAVILFLSDEVLQDPKRGRAMAYVGMSRARFLLVACGSLSVHEMLGNTLG